MHCMLHMCICLNHAAATLFEASGTLRKKCQAAFSLKVQWLWPAMHSTVRSSPPTYHLHRNHRGHRRGVSTTQNDFTMVKPRQVAASTKPAGTATGKVRSRSGVKMAWVQQKPTHGKGARTGTRERDIGDGKPCHIRYLWVWAACQHSAGNFPSDEVASSSELCADPAKLNNIQLSWPLSLEIRVHSHDESYLSVLMHAMH